MHYEGTIIGCNCPHVRPWCSAYTNICSRVEQRWSKHHYLYKSWLICTKSLLRVIKSLVFCTFTMFGCDAMHILVSKTCCEKGFYDITWKLHAFYKKRLSTKWTHMLYLNCDRASAIYRRAVGMFKIKNAPKWEEKYDCAVLLRLNRSICSKYRCQSLDAKTINIGCLCSEFRIL